MLAVTPMLAALMASRMPWRELLVESILTVPVATVPFCVNVAPVYFPASRVPPLMVPN